jgi:hypothetical protein
MPVYIVPSQNYEKGLQSNGGRYRGYFIQSEENLVELKKDLKEADDYVSDEDFSKAIDCYMELARSFIEEHHDYHVSAYLYKKCIELSKLCEVKNELIVG